MANKYEYVEDKYYLWRKLWVWVSVE